MEQSRYVNTCLGCDCWDPDAEGCTMPSVDRSYACGLEQEVGGTEDGTE